MSNVSKRAVLNLPRHEAFCLLAMPPKGSFSTVRFIFFAWAMSVLASSLGCDKPQTDEINFGIDLRPRPEVTLPVGESFMVYTSSEYVSHGGRSYGSLPRGFVFQATKYMPGHDHVYGWVQIPRDDGSLLEGWVYLNNTVRKKSLAEVGMHVFPLPDNSGLEVRLSQAAALQLSQALQQVNEKTVGPVVEQIAGQLANHATTAATTVATSSPQVGKIAGQMAEFVVQVLVAAAQGNLTKFKNDLAVAAANGDVSILLQSPASQNNFDIYPNEPEIDFSPFGSRIAPQDYGDIQYYIRLQKSALSISPATFVNSSYWSIQNVEL